MLAFFAKKTTHVIGRQKMFLVEIGHVFTKQQVWGIYILYDVECDA